MDEEFAVTVINRITENLGGSPTATTVVPALEELEQAIGSGIDPSVVEQVLEEHPEWTTTLQDGAVTLVKFSDEMYTLLSVEDVENLF